MVNINTNIGGVRNSVVASQPCPLGHITADKREIKDFPKLPSATSFIRKTLAEIPHAALGIFKIWKETFMTHGDTHEDENAFSYQIKTKR